jgi:hypothetical protein
MLALVLALALVQQLVALPLDLLPLARPPPPRATTCYVAY